jgi:hypothetical protein
LSKHTGYCLRRDEHGLVSVAVTAKAGGWEIADLSRTAADGKPSRSLRDAMGKATTPVTWLLPDEEAGVSHVSLPRLRPKALRQALTGGLARDEGGRPEDWCVSWKAQAGKQGRDSGERTPYVMYHASRQIVDKNLLLAGKWGLDLRRMLPGHLALDLFYRAHGPGRDEHKVWNLVFVGQEQHFLFVATRDAQLMIRNLPADLSGGEDAAEYLKRLATEIERSVFFARQTENSPEVEKIIVCGDPSLAAPLVNAIGESSPIPTVHWAIEDMFEWGDHECHIDDLLTVAGAVLALEKVPFNLVAERGLLQLGPAAKRRILVAGAACAAATVPMLIVGSLVTTRIQGTYLDRAGQRLVAAQVRADQAEQAYDAQRVLLAREDHIRRFAQKRPDFESVLLRLAALTPGEIVFTDLQVRERYDGRFRVQIFGESRGRSGEVAQGAFLQFLTALDACDFLTRKGEPRVMQIRPGLDKMSFDKVTVFQLELEWRSTREEVQ